MRKVGTIQSIWRYPVKGMAGETVTQCRLGAGGLTGDRTWAVQDLQRQEVQSCKFRPELLLCQARSCTGSAGELTGEVEITLPNNTCISSADPKVHALVSEVIGHESRLCSVQPFDETTEQFYRRFKQDDHTWLEELKATFTREPGEPLPDLDNLPQSMQDYVSIPGTFFLVSHFHILTTASLAHMQSLYAESDWAVERFRPNVVIETDPGCEGLIEQGWVGHTLRIGELEIECNSPAPRCGAVTREQKYLPKDTGILRRIVRQAEQNLGVYGEIRGEATLHSGDEVFLL